MIFQGISVARNCPAPLTILAIKKALLCNFAKKFKGHHFMGHSGTDFQLLLNSKSSKLPLIVFFKKLLILNLKKEPFFQILR